MPDEKKKVAFLVTIHQIRVTFLLFLELFRMVRHHAAETPSEEPIKIMPEGRVKYLKHVAAILGDEIRRFYKGPIKSKYMLSESIYYLFGTDFISEQTYAYETPQGAFDCRVPPPLPTPPHPRLSFPSQEKCMCR